MTQPLALRSLTIAALIVAAPPPRTAIAAQQPSDEQALAAYRLTEPTLTKFVQASRAMAAAAREQRDSLDDEGENPESIADIAAFYDRHPLLRRAIAGAGLTSREYVLFMLTLFQAGMGAWLVQQQGWGKLPKEIARENVVFYQRHKTQLDSLTAELKEREGDPP